MFPTAGSIIYRNEDGEVLGWDSTSYDEPEYDDGDPGLHAIGCGCEFCSAIREDEDEDEDEEPDPDREYKEERNGDNDPRSWS